MTSAAPPELDGFLAPGRELRPAAGGFASALPAADGGAPYDRHARVYDKLIGNGAYNRLIWGTQAAGYPAFAQEAVASGSGAMLDAGCGTAIFTADAYRATSRPLVLVDRSLGMLTRAAERLGAAPAALLQADLFDLPFAPGRFETVASFSMLQVLDDPWRALEALREHSLPAAGSSRRCSSPTAAA